MKSLKAKFRKSDAHEWNKNDERLLSAVEHGEADKVTSLLTKKGASAVKLDNEGKSALHVAATRGQTECLAVILAHGVDASLLDGSGFSALHLAAKNDHQECAKKLIQSKCVIDALDSSGKTALHHAAACGSIIIVQLLCEHKCPVNLKDAEGFTPLLISARHGHAEVCRSLMDWGADVNACDKSSRSVVMLACESSCVATVDILVQRGADLQIVDSLGHDVLHYAKLSGSSEVQALLTSALQKPPKDSDMMSPKPPQHYQVARLYGDRSATPKKRKAPPPPISPIQNPQMADMASQHYLTPTETLLSSKSDTSNTFTYQEDELKSIVIKEEIEKLQEEKSMLLETIEDLKQIVEQTHPQVENCGNEEPSLVATLQAKIAALSLENQQLAHILKKRNTPQGEEGQDASRPNSIDSNASYHSTHTEFDNPSEESRLENQTLQARLTPPATEEETETESTADLHAKIGETQEKYQEAMQEVLALRAEINPLLTGQGNVTVAQSFRELKASMEQEVKELKSKLAQLHEEHERDASLIQGLETQLESMGSRVSMEEFQEVKSSYSVLVENLNQEKTVLMGSYKESQEEIKMLQEALQGTVPVEAAAKDFEEMKAELDQVIESLQRRLLELSHSYSEAKSELSSALSQLEARPTEEPRSGPDVACITKEQHEQQLQDLVHKMEEAQGAASEAKARHSAALKEINLLRQEAEMQAQSSVALTDHTQIVASLGSAIKDLEAQVEALKEQLSEKALQVEALQNRLTVVKDALPDDSMSRLEYEQLRESLEGEVSQLTLLLQDALRKQDDITSEAATAWQEVKEGNSERETMRGLVAAINQEKNELNSKYRDAQEALIDLKKRTAGLVSAEQAKTKKNEDLTKEVSKLKEALNSLSQLSYTTGIPKRQNLQVDSLQQQVKQLQYQLTESKKQHHEIVSVYRMHLLYAVQGQMDEDVQKALKQILMMQDGNRCQVRPLI
ncbi:hypothetical protein AAFF_G00031190 [Aldrovandia affinis]|uniref:Ankycorbin n=1 Tax=Aldrovandia affinis TaxID=143900 RepID=A0AAD7WG72_9TELE|nr:hypothetical protein AAFF_G00031190 [Aldrovandia affinis]